MQVQSLGGEDPLEEGMATHSSIFAWRITWTEELGWLQFMGSQRVRHDRSDWACVHRIALYYLLQLHVNLHLSATNPNSNHCLPHWLTEKLSFLKASCNVTGKHKQTHKQLIRKVWPLTPCLPQPGKSQETWGKVLNSSIESRVDLLSEIKWNSVIAWLIIWRALGCIVLNTGYRARAAGVIYSPGHIILWPAFRQFQISAIVHIATWAQFRRIPVASAPHGKHSLPAESCVTPGACWVALHFTLPVRFQGC